MARTTTDTPATDPEASEPGPGSSYLAAIAEDYAQFVAAGPIHVGGALAFVAGMPVPASHPFREQWVADGLVVPAI